MRRFWEHLKRHIVPSHHNAYQPHLLRRSWLIFFLAIALMAEGYLATNLMVRQSSQTYLAAVVPAEVIALTNTQRSQNGVGSLTEDKELDRAAQAKANDMIAKGYFAHQGPDGTKPWDWILRAGYSYRYAGENLAVRFVDSNDVVNAWMASPTHRANIVKPVYTQIGIGVAQGTYQGVSATYIVQFFATPLSPASHVQAAAASFAVGGNWLSSVVQKIVRIMGRVQAEPVAFTNTTLWAIALLLLVVLGITVALHTHIQSTHTIAATCTVVGILIILATANASFLTGKSQSAAVLEASGALSGTTVSLGEDATTTQVILDGGI